jgi:hypothetical protein
MSNANIAVTALFKLIAPFSLNFAEIMGADTLKRVYWYFPPNMKGVIYLFHGTNGSTSNWVNAVEGRQFVNDAVADTFGVLITEAEEVTKRRDLDGDGALRWYQLPLDSTTNIDMRNIKALTDTFVTRGQFTRATKRYSVGFSNGGFFSADVSLLFRFTAGASYCAQAIDTLFSRSTIPFQWCMARYDRNIGQEGNAEAYQNYFRLVNRGVCAGYFLHDRSPLYPQRFMRISGVDSLLSQTITNELIANGVVDSTRYLRFPSSAIDSLVIGNPSSFPVLVSLTSVLRIGVAEQIDATFAAHQFYGDYDRITLSFLNRLCAGTSGVEYPTESALPREFSLYQNYPNPFNPTTTIRYDLPSAGLVSLKVFDILGREIRTLVNEVQDAGFKSVRFSASGGDATGLASGVYFYTLHAGSFSATRKLLLMR